MEPKTDQLLSLSEIFRVCLEQSFEHVGEVPHVELVVEICRGFAERVAHLGRHGQRDFADLRGRLVDH